MNREEFQTERTRIISEMLDNPDEYGIYPTTKCFEQLDALFDSLSLPLAEGAEEILTEEQFTAIIKATCEDVWYGRRSLDPVKEQTELIVKKVYPLLTLHAQRIADKMVEERLKEELIKFVKWYNRDFEEARKPHLIVKEYLKSREDDKRRINSLR